jgi:hypothetical protein
MNRQPFKSEKRRKELARQKKQEEKRQKREERKTARLVDPEGGVPDPNQEPAPSEPPAGDTP